MSTFSIIALICAGGMGPYECQPPTARERISLGTVSNELMCGIESQQHLAQVASLIKQDEWVKFVCLRNEDEKL
jgi:hypothetical protein